jgi:hypothetical protein
MDKRQVHTERQLPISGVHSIMMEKSGQAGEGGECMPAHPLSLYLPSPAKLQCTLYAPAERADTFPLFHLYPYMYSVG